MLISSIKNFLFRKEFTRNLSILVGTSVIGYAITLVVSPLLTRLYSPADFGALQVFFSWYLVGFVIVCARYDTAILIPKNERTAFELAIISFCVVLLISSLSIGLILFVKPFAQQFAQVALMAPYFWLFPFALFFGGVYQIFSQLAIRSKAFKEIGRTKITQSAGQALTQILLGLASKTAWGLVIGNVVGRAGGGLFLARRVSKFYITFFKEFSWQSVRSIAWHYRAFPFVSSWAALINTLGLMVPPLLFANLYDLQTLGFFSLTEQAFAAPNALLGLSVSQVYNGTIAKMLSQPRALQTVFKKTAIQLFGIGAVPFGIVILFGKPLFTLVFGNEWAKAGEYAQILAIMQWIGFVSSPLSHTLNLLQKQRWQLAWDIVRLILSVGSLYVVYYFSKEPVWGIVAYAFSLSIMYFVHLFLCNFAIKRTKVA